MLKCRPHHAVYLRVLTITTGLSNLVNQHTLWSQGAYQLEIISAQLGTYNLQLISALLPKDLVHETIRSVCDAR